MSALWGWGLALAAAVFGWINYGWQGVVTVATVAVFWLLLQFNRTMKVMKNAAHAPVGHVGSAVMLNARLAPHMTMLQIVNLTKSLGRQTGTAPETWVWADAGGSAVTLVMSARGRLESWQLARPSDANTESGGEAPASP